MADHANSSKRHRGETFLFTSESVGEGHPGALGLAWGGGGATRVSVIVLNSLRKEARGINHLYVASFSPSFLYR